MANIADACSQTQVIITAQDLPLTCPNHSQSLWNAHPKVSLEIKPNKPAICPYCGTKYILINQS